MIILPLGSVFPMDIHYVCGERLKVKKYRMDSIGTLKRWDNLETKAVKAVTETKYITNTREGKCGIYLVDRTKIVIPQSFCIQDCYNWFSDFFQS